MTKENLPAELYLDTNSILFSMSSSLSAFRLMLLFQCPCQTWPRSQRDDAFVWTDAAGGGAPNTIQPSVPIQAGKQKCSCVLQPYGKTGLIRALFCVTQVVGSSLPSFHFHYCNFFSPLVVNGCNGKKKLK